MQRLQPPKPPAYTCTPPAIVTQVFDHKTDMPVLPLCDTFVCITLYDTELPNVSGLIDGDLLSSGIFPPEIPPLLRATEIQLSEIQHPS